MIEDGISPGEISIVVFANTAGDFAKFEFGDLPHDGVAQGEVGDDDDSAEESGFEGFEEFGVKSFGESVV